MAGNVAVHQLPELPSRPLLTLLALVAALLCIFRRLRPAGVACGFFCLTAVVAAGRLADRLDITESHVDVELRGWVDDFPRREPLRTVFTLRTAGPDPATAEDRLPLRVRLSWYEPPVAIEPGASLALSVRLRPPRGLVNPGGFDYERWLLTQRIGATGYVRGGTVDAGSRYGLPQAWLRLRARLAASLSASVDDGAAGALVAALGVGVRAGFTDEQWTVLRRTGTSHLVAISGLHIGLVAVFAFQVLLRSLLAAGGAAARHAWTVAAVCTLLPAGFYAALAGFALPTLRALLMLGVAQAVILSRRRVAPVTGLALALIAVLAVDPLATLGASFWLSFGAVAAIVAGLRQRSGPVPVHGSMLARGADALLVLCRLQLVIGVALLPLSALFFAEVSLVAFPVNLLAVPLFSLVLVPVSLLLIGALAAGIGVAPLGTVAGSVAASVWAALAAAAKLPGAAFGIAQPSAAGVGIAAAGVVAFFALRSRRRWLGLAGLTGLLLRPPDRPPPGAFDLHTLDVGHGLAVVVRTATHSLVFDAGPESRSGFDAGREIVVPALESLTPGRLDLIVVSHGDSDHAGGLAALRSAHPTTPQLGGPDVAAGNGALCAAGQGWIWDEVAFRILHPHPGFTGQGNDSSCVLEIASTAGTALLTGDIEQRAESALVAAGIGPADIVLAPHHGSNTSSSAAFVRATRPRHVIVSAAYGNRWNFPRPDVVSRWRDNGSEVHTTGNDGAIGVRVSSEGIRIEKLRETQRRYWTAASGTRRASAL